MDAGNSSKYHLMRGMIALAWADGKLATAERVMLERFIDTNQHLTLAQRDALKESIATPISIKEVWQDISDVQDRARLIDVAGAIFHADGDYSASEKEVYEEMLATHMAALNQKALVREMEAMALRARQNAIQVEAEYKEEVRKGPEKTPSKMGLMIFRINKAMGN